MPALLLILLFIAVPIAELAVIIEVGQAIGLIPTIAILLVDSIVGGVLLRSQGRVVWRRFSEATRAGRVPHREALDGALVIFGGALLLTPGFISDVVGLLFLIPPTRAIARRLVARLIARRVFVGVMGLRGRGPRGPAAPRRRPAPASSPTGRRYDVEGTASEINGSPDERSSPRLDR